MARNRTARRGGRADASEAHDVGTRQALALIASCIDEGHKQLVGPAAGAVWLEVQRTRTEKQVVLFLMALVKHLALDVGKGTGEAPEDVVVRVVTAEA